MKLRLSLHPPSPAAITRPDSHPDAGGKAPFWGRGTVHLAGLAILAIGAYSNTFAVPLVQDDPYYIADSARVMDPGRVLSEWTWNRRLVGALSFALQYRVHGFSLAGFHAANLAIHVLAGWTLYVFASRTLARTGIARLEARMAALLASALFVVHPLQTEAVTYLARRITSLAALLYLASILSYSESRWAAGTRRAGWLLSAALLAAILAMRTKEVAVTLPLAILLYEVVFLAGPWKRRALPIAAMAATSLVLVSTLADSTRNVVTSLEDATRLQTRLPRSDYLLTEIPIVASYLRMWAIPAGQNVDHDPPLRHSVDSKVVATGVILTALALSGLLAVRTRTSGEVRVAGFGILFFFVTISLESSVFPIVDVMVERRLYLPSAGLSLAAGAGVLWLWRHAAGAARAWLTAAAGAWVLGLAGLCWARNDLWRDPVKLWADAVEKSPGRFRARTHLATLMMERGEYAEARRQLEVSLTLDPRYAKTVGQMGNLFWAEGRRGDACRQFERCVELDPKLAPCRYNLGGCFEMIGDKRAAEEQYRAFLAAAQPDDYRQVEILKQRFGW